MKPWGGRFEKPTDKRVEAFTASIPFDRRLYRQDIAGSIAHAHMLARQGIIAAAEAKAIVAGLHEILAEIERGEFPFRLELEDIHLNIEARLREKTGDVAGKLHTARSRNDQIALDMRLFVREAIVEAVGRLAGLQEALLTLAEANREAIFPGYTHLQRAQPVLFSHHLLAYFEMFARDVGRFQDAYRRVDVSPLGAGALAGVPYPIDPQAVADELGFAGVAANSIDAVSDRDFVVEYAAAASLAMMHLSRLAEELIIWSSAEFGFIEMDDSFTTGSSIMPQKKNPDVAELTRGKTGRVYGHLMGILTVLKALALAYNRDFQEDKEGLFDTVDTLLDCLDMMAGLLHTSRANAGRMRAAVDELTLATDLADYLVRRGLPFRQAHEVVGRMVHWCLAHERTFSQLSLEEYRSFSSLFQEDVLSLTVESALSARRQLAGTAPEQVAQALVAAGARLAEARSWAEQARANLSKQRD
ncbi:MAG: argininosuccinate lyase [Bacteroidetes bacterium]|nr:argininosuccinate lyase [Bacteroidota bacterium]